MMSKKLSNTSGRKPSVRRPKRQQSNAALPLTIGGLAVLLVLILAVKAGSSSPSKPADRNVSAAEQAEKDAEIDKAIQDTINNPKKETAKVEEKKTAPVTEENAPEVETAKVETAKVETKPEVKLDNRSIQDIKVEVRQLTIERKFDEAMAMIDNYNGPHNLTLLRREVELKKEDHRVYGDRVQVNEPVADQPRPEMRKPVAAAKPAPNQPLKPLGNNARGDRGPNGFLYETEADKKKIKKAPAVNLVVHSQTVGLPRNVIVVWKDRQLVLSYSRLIKNCENKKSKHYPERVEKAKKFLEEHRDEYELIPYAKAKMTLRSKGFTVSEVFFNQTVQMGDEYKNTSKTDRYKGFIISYDIKPPSVGGGFGMGC